MLFDFEDFSKIIRDVLYATWKEPLEVALVLGTVVFIAILLVENRNISFGRTSQLGCSKYSYRDDENGPVTWKDKYCEALGCKQSPINLSRRSACTTTSRRPLMWSRQYLQAANSIKITNDSHTVMMTLDYDCASPAISEGCLGNSYELCTIRFRWGELDFEGSEHSVNYVRYAMELQAIHALSGIRQPTCDQDVDGILIVSYFYQVTEADNPYLEPLVSRLKCIRPAHTSCVIPGFPISWLMPLFFTDYFVYDGSLTFPPCSEGVKWIIQPEPLAISANQIRKFRKLLSSNGPLKSNCRPLQNVNKRQ